MRRSLTILALVGICVLSFGLDFECIPTPKEDPTPTVVGVMYHHWWVPGRWSHNPLNHPYEPVLGHYDNANASVIRQHIAWAKQYGINTFVLNFWITDWDWWWVERNTNAVADICDQEGMKYFFLIDGWFHYEDPDVFTYSYEIAWRVNARAAQYWSRPGYLREQGKPVVFFWASGGTDCGLWQYVRSGIEGTSGPIYMTGERWDCFDLRMLYSPYISTATSYQDLLDHQDNLWSSWSRDGRPFAPTALPGFDDHLVRSGNPAFPIDPEHFRQSVRLATKYDQHHADDRRWLFICSWSEWHEGSQIEPSSNFADPEIFLKVLKQELDALE
jgi:hypothetical protein